MMDTPTTEDNTEILVIEDSLTQVEYLKYMLETHHYSILTATSAEKALAMLQTHQPAIIISDILMPGMDGYEFCRQVKNTPALNHIPVILLTQLSTPHDIIKGLESGADNFIIKPYNEEQLLVDIQYILANRGLRHEPLPETTLDVIFRGQKYAITSSRFQIIDLLFSTYEAAMQKQKELEQKNQVLQEALETIKVLEGFIPICANCKKVRNDEGFWQQVEVYIESHSQATITHGICPDCMKELYGTIGPDAPPQE